VNPDPVQLTIIAAGGIVAAAIDLRTRRVPNALVAVIAAAGLGVAVFGAARVGLAGACAGCALGVLLMLPGYAFGGTGGGDVKLLGAFGTLLGPAGVVHAWLAMAIAGGVLALAVAVYRRRAGQKDNRFAYAPAIAAGACVAAIGW
jgi:prepilin peptidase CpaA